MVKLSSKNYFFKLIVANLIVDDSKTHNSLKQRLDHACQVPNGSMELKPNTNKTKKTSSLDNC
jgi:hypothetical protein